MTDLDQKYAKVIDSTRAFPQQLASGHAASLNVRIPVSYSNTRNIVFSGMGGSSLPAHIITSSLPLTVPHAIVNDYTLPSWVNSKTLVILSSYSGNTEE